MERTIRSVFTRAQIRGNTNPDEWQDVISVTDSLYTLSKWADYFQESFQAGQVLQLPLSMLA
jgi:hypothetical protein